VAVTTALPTPARTTRPRKDPRRFLSAPGLIFLILVTQVPFALTIYFSFTNWNLLRPASKGLLPLDRFFRNFARVLSNPDFFAVLVNTVYLTGAVVLLTFVFGLVLALLLELQKLGPGESLKVLRGEGTFSVLREETVLVTRASNVTDIQFKIDEEG